VQGLTAIGTTPKASAKVFRTEMEKYGKLVKLSGMTLK
jgi:hypothetical protein